MKDALKKSTLLAASAALLAGMTACGPVAPFGPQGQSVNRVGSFANNPVRGGKKWSLMIHMAADNNLYSFGLEDVNEMEAGLGENPAAAADVDVFVLFDGSPNGDSKILHILPDPGPVNTKIISETVDDKGFVVPSSHEIDSGDPVVAGKFVDFITKNFPAEHTLHAIWNHGSGIFRNGTNSPEFLAGGSFFDTVVGGPRMRGSASRLFGMDDNGGEMHLSDVATFIGPALKNQGKPVDIVGFDACLMQHVETAYQYKGLANFLVASEQLEPGKGWDYKGFIGPLAKNPNMSPAQLAKTMVDSYKASYMPGGSQGNGEATLSALDINAVVNVLVPAINDFAAEAKAALPGAKAAFDTARNSTQVFYNRDAADLGDFLKKFKGGPAADKLRAAIGQTLVAEGHVGSKVANATGVQIYFPTSSMSVKSSYDDANFLRYAETKGWSSFLHAYTGK